jgi:hypothetical protein
VRASLATAYLHTHWLPHPPLFLSLHADPDAIASRILSCSQASSRTSAWQRNWIAAPLIQPLPALFSTLASHGASIQPAAEGQDGDEWDPDKLLDQAEQQQLAGRQAEESPLPRGLNEEVRPAWRPHMEPSSTEV